MRLRISAGDGQSESGQPFIRLSYERYLHPSSTTSSSRIDILLLSASLHHYHRKLTSTMAPSKSTSNFSSPYVPADNILNQIFTKRKGLKTKSSRRRVDMQQQGNLRAVFACVGIKEATEEACKGTTTKEQNGSRESRPLVCVAA
jgi:hypothetical protein